LNNDYHKNGYYITTDGEAYNADIDTINSVRNSYINDTNIRSIYYDKTDKFEDTSVKYSNFNVDVDSIGIKLNSYINSSLRIEEIWDYDIARYVYIPIITKGTQIILNTSNCFDIAFRNKTAEYHTYDFTRLG